MLTKSDLQQIGGVIDERLGKRLNPIEKDLKDVKKIVRKIEKTVDVVIDHFDREIVRTQKRVAIIEDNLNL